MDPIIAAVVMAKTTIVACAAVLAILGFRAYRRRRAPAMRTLALGFAVITVAGLLAGVGFQVSVLDFEASIAIQSVGTAIGALVVTYSLFEDRPLTVG
ncbi:DUF7521 family protein [Halococcoides cellulosivorans]|uniref:Uncharacterized protein n=1 Tax=Halococcoides cellulosivorans TaxID=1679096 RepID=A0A2R4X2T1_9EURY|nr:hypothetical protein [Halococcoides cellulosivorans]AWB28106.1 hypothetical protein HARCEL1_10505 [Halococcoides cellulosivorans]